MRTYTLSAFAGSVGLLAAACGAPPAKLVPPPPVNPATAIVGATLWDGTGRAPVSNAVTVVRGERILCAGAAGECSVPQGAKVIEARGQYLIPGMIDSHVHLLFLQNGSAVEDLGLDLRDLLAQGITTVRDMSREMWPRRIARSPKRSLRILATSSFGTSGSPGSNAVLASSRSPWDRAPLPSSPAPARATLLRNDRRLAMRGNLRPRMIEVKERRRWRLAACAPRAARFD